MTAPTFGPVDVVVLGSPEPTLPDAVDAAILALTRSDAVSVIDLVHVTRTVGGDVLVSEVEEAPPGDTRSGLFLAASGLVGDDDIAAVAESLAPGTSAVVLAIEHTWARSLVDAVSRSTATLVATERIPASVVAEVVQAARLPQD